MKQLRSSRQLIKNWHRREKATVDSLMETMTAGRFRHVPVIENDRLVGLVSIGDVVKHHVAEIETEQRALKEYIASA